MIQQPGDGQARRHAPPLAIQYNFDQTNSLPPFPAPAHSQFSVCFCMFFR
jgi:hypothetical protein